jgi:RNA polymerase sigma factor (sigma-70 family)
MFDSSDGLEEVVKLKLRQLGLDRAEFSGLVRLEDLVAAARLERQINPIAPPDLLVIRQIGAKIYYACQLLDEQLRNKAYLWLGNYLFSHLIKAVKGDKELAEDLTNSTLERIVLKIQTCRMPTSLLKWVNTIAANQTAEYFRKNKPNNPAQEDVPAVVLTRFDEVIENIVASDRLEPERIILRRETTALLLKKIHSLKNTKRAAYYKNILIGTYFEGLDDQLLAQRLNLPVQEVQKMRYQALKVLQSDREFINQIR